MKQDLSTLIAKTFITSRITPVIIILAFMLGLLTLAKLPREEEPQISVPMVDIMVRADGLPAVDAVELVTKPLEDIIKGIEGVEHVYSRTQDDASIVTARFYVGEEEDRAILRVHETIRAHLDQIPYNIPMPFIVGHGINDVPILVLNLSPKAETASRWDDTALYNVAEELLHELVKIQDIGLSFIVGGHPNQIRIEPAPEKLNLYGITLNQLVNKIKFANQVFALEPIHLSNQKVPFIAGATLQTPAEIENLTLTTADGRLVYLSDVAHVVFDKKQDDQRIWGWAKGEESLKPSVSIALAKRPGANASTVSQKVRNHLKSLKPHLIPDSIEVTVARDYGLTAKDKANNLLFSLLAATLSIVFIISLVEGWREGLTVFIVIPMTILLTLFFSWQFGYTLNRVSLFALIFSIGILVDDAIVITQNIKRHWQQTPGDPQNLALKAIKEIGTPTIMANLTILAALLPMLFVSGLMGPYMGPIPVNASAAVMLSLLIALMVTPWLMLKLKSSSTQVRDNQPDIFATIYTFCVTPIIQTRLRSKLFLGIIIVLTCLSLSLFYFKKVTVKMLPFDNKSELQVLLDMPEGTSMETTERTLKQIFQQISSIEEISHAWLYVASSAPFNFNGLVRQHYFRKQPHQAEIQLKLVKNSNRNSHAIAQDIRNSVRQLNLADNINTQIIEMPPGPPVFATLLMEVYGKTAEERRDLAKKVKMIYDKIPFIVDTDISFGEQSQRLRIIIDHAQLEFFGAEEEAVLDTLYALLNPIQVGYSQRGHGINPIEISLALPQNQRVLNEYLLTTPIPSKQGVIELGDVVHIVEETSSYPILRRNGRFIEMVTGELAGEFEAPIYGMLAVNHALQHDNPENPPQIHYYGQPENEQSPSLLWEGEWEITYVTFRDLGFAFMAALIGIYALLIIQFNSFKLPLVILIPIPLSMLGIVLGHWVFHANFTATSMIGFISLAGIMIRNALLLIEFIRNKRQSGLALREALLEAGRIRFKPIFMTAITAMVGAAFMIPDPIFEGLGIALLFGLASSTLLMMLVIPAIYIIARGEDSDNSTSTA